MPIIVKRLGTRFFAEVENIDIRKPLGDATIDAINEAIGKHAVLLFRAPDLTDQEQMKFTRYFGELENVQLRVGRDRNLKNQFVADMSNVDGDGNIIAPESEKIMFQKGNQLWHTDSSFKPIPSGPSFLSARVIPAQGGNTEFADLRAAWDALPAERQELLEGLVAEHSLEYSRRRYGYTDFNTDERNLFPAVQQSMVRIHPETGRKNLYLGSHAGRIVGMDKTKSDALLEDLIQFATQPDFVYAHTWSVGDLVMWDNRCALHRARPYNVAAEVRILRRTTVQGTRTNVVGGKPIDEFAAARVDAQAA